MLVFVFRELKINPIKNWAYSKYQTSFKQKQGLIRHRRKCLKKEEIDSSTCIKTFYRNDVRLKYSLVCKGEKGGPVCQSCNEKFKAYWHLKRHVKWSHSGKNSKTGYSASNIDVVSMDKDFVPTMVDLPYTNQGKTCTLPPDWTRCGAQDVELEMQVIETEPDYQINSSQDWKPILNINKSIVFQFFHFS